MINNIKQGVRMDSHKDKRDKKSSSSDDEDNVGILKSILMPDIIFLDIANGMQRFEKTRDIDKIHKDVAGFKSSRDKIKEQALQDDRFLEFLKTAEAVIERDNYIKDIQSSIQHKELHINVTREEGLRAIMQINDAFSQLHDFSMLSLKDKKKQIKSKNSLSDLIGSPFLSFSKDKKKEDSDDSISNSSSPMKKKRKHGGSKK